VWRARIPHRPVTAYALRRRDAIYPFERFTERAKKVLTLAQEEAEGSGHSYIGTEHILLGLLREKDGVAAQALVKLGVDIDMVRRTIESVLSRHERTIIQQIVPTSRVKKVIEHSFEEARRMGDNYVGTEHMLLGLLAEGEGIAAHVLVDLGATLERVRVEIEQMLAAGTGGPVHHRTAYKIGDRVLVHDTDAPHRLWEGRVIKVDDPHFEISVVGRPQGEVVTAKVNLIHPIPMTWTRDCPFCKDG
jgi:hypothetical protein